MIRRTLVIACCVVVIVGASVGAAFASFGSTTQPPVNDRFEHAVDLSSAELPATDRIDATLATARAFESHSGAGVATVWWRFSPRSAGDFVVTTENSAVGTVLAVYLGSEPSSLTAVGVASGAAGTGAAVSVPGLSATDTIMIAVDQQNGTGEVQMSIGWDVPAAANDVFASAAVLTGGNVTASAHTGGASSELSEPLHGGEPAARSVWWKWKAPGTGTATIDTCSSQFDTTLGVYAGSVLAGLVPIAEADDSGLTCDTEAFGLSSVTFPVVQDATYHIAVDGFFGDSGPVVLNLSGQATQTDTITITRTVGGGAAPSDFVFTVEPEVAGCSATQVANIDASGGQVGVVVAQTAAVTGDPCFYTVTENAIVGFTTEARVLSAVVANATAAFADNGYAGSADPGVQPVLELMRLVAGSDASPLIPPQLLAAPAAVGVTVGAAGLRRRRSNSRQANTGR